MRLKFNFMSITPDRIDVMAQREFQEQKNKWAKRVVVERSPRTGESLGEIETDWSVDHFDDETGEAILSKKIGDRFATKSMSRESFQTMNFSGAKESVDMVSGELKRVDKWEGMRSHKVEALRRLKGILDEFRRGKNGDLGPMRDYLDGERANKDRVREGAAMVLNEIVTNSERQTEITSLEARKKELERKIDTLQELFKAAIKGAREKSNFSQINREIRSVSGEIGSINNRLSLLNREVQEQGERLEEAQGEVEKMEALVNALDKEIGKRTRAAA